MKVDVLLEPAQIREFAKCDLGGVLCVVFDVLRATSSMVTGLQYGMAGLRPVTSVQAALELHKQHPGALLGGERHGDRIEGFHLGNSPLEYRDHPGATVITTTTNGTLALDACRSAEVVLVAALLNLEAVASRISEVRPRRLVAVCSGTGDGLALEDVWAAGALLNRFQTGSWSDAAHVAHALYQQFPDPMAALSASENGRALLAKGRLADVEWCAQLSRFDVLGVLVDGLVQRADAPSPQRINRGRAPAATIPEEPLHG